MQLFDIWNLLIKNEFKILNVIKRVLYFQNGRLGFLISIYVLKALLDVLYVLYVHPVWSNKGFGFELSYVKYIESWFVLILISLSLPHALKRPSDLFLFILAVCLLLPMTSLYGLSNDPRWVLYSVLFGFFLIALVRSGKFLAIPIWMRGYHFSLLVSSIIVVVVIVWIVFSGGYLYININLKEVYEYRSDVNSVVNRGVFAYLNSWAFKVFNLFLFAYALAKKNWLLAALFFTIQIFLFAVMAQKAILIFPFVILAIWYYFKRNNKLLIISIGLINIILAVTLIWQISSDTYSFPISLVVRRMFFVAANNVYDYFVYFSHNPHIYWSNSITSDWISYPYSINYPHLIGDYQAAEVGRNSQGVYANSSFVATGYMHAGFVGLLFYCVLVGALFRLIDSLAFQTMPLWFAISVTVIPVGSLLLSADLPTALLTHGILVNLVLLYLCRGNCRMEKL